MHESNKPTSKCCKWHSFRAELPNEDSLSCKLIKMLFCSQLIWPSSPTGSGPLPVPKLEGSSPPGAWVSWGGRAPPPLAWTCLPSQNAAVIRTFLWQVGQPSASALGVTLSRLPPGAARCDRLLFVVLRPLSLETVAAPGPSSWCLTALGSEAGDPCVPL